ncbi:hypothetical protein B0T18DRAFT_400629 [Schizothecium vesticola]|uniref:Secreted protein n=1 Tax=Schizothecium vesticola TaxID=314040 RepID=A0AA40KDM5_9PEZI|nr:hypothetical protein B0T18DRAFT_400629 [Schizothecium vesticola]
MTFTASAASALIFVAVGPAATTASPTSTSPAAACPGDATMKNTVGVCGHPVTRRSSCTRTEKAALARRRDAPRRRSATNTGCGTKEGERSRCVTSSPAGTDTVARASEALSRAMGRR